MARGRYTETLEIRALRHFIRFAQDPAVKPLELAKAGKAYLHVAVTNALAALPWTEAQQIKQDLHALLVTLAQRPDASAAPATEHHFTVTLTAAKSGRGVLLFVDGAPRDVLLYQACTFLDRTGTDRLQSCPAPNCGRLFIKLGRREFCSPTCQRRVYLATYNPFAARPRRTTEIPKATSAKKTRSRHGKTKTR